MQTRYIITGGVDTFLTEGCDPEVTAVPFMRTLVLLNKYNIIYPSLEASTYMIWASTEWTWNQNLLGRKRENNPDYRVKFTIPLHHYAVVIFKLFFALFFSLS